MEFITFSNPKLPCTNVKPLSWRVSDNCPAPHYYWFRCQMNWWVVVRRGTNGCLDYSMDRWALSGTYVQAPWNGVLEIVSLFCDEAQQVGYLRGLDDCPLVWSAGIQSQFTRRRWWRGRRGEYEHCGTKHRSAVLCGWKYQARVDTERVAAPAPQLEPASRLRSVEHDVSFLRSDLRCWRYVSDLSNVTLRYLGSEQKSRVVLLYLTLSSRLASLLLRMKTADTVFVVLNFSFQVWRYSPTVNMSLVCAHSTAWQSPSACMIARSSSSAYAYFLRWLLADRRCRCWTVMAPGQIPVGRHLLHLQFLVLRVKLRLPTISMIIWSMCLPSGSCSSLQVRPRSHTVS